jgi:hypothetical protein
MITHKLVVEQIQSSEDPHGWGIKEIEDRQLGIVGFALKHWEARSEPIAVPVGY